MAAVVSAADANREFSKLLRQVRQGKSITITSHGRPVAKLVPVGAEERVRATARTALFEHLRRQKRGRIRTITWKRDDLYERDEGDH
jgi:prevent-host-death family protein